MYSNKLDISFLGNIQSSLRKVERSNGMFLQINILDARGFVRGTIRNNQRKQKRKRSESFDFSLYVPRPQLDQSDDESDEFEGYDFDCLDDASNHKESDRNSFKMLDGQNDLNKNLEDINEDQENLYNAFLGDQKKNDEYSFGFGGGYSMKVATNSPIKEDNH
jgi:hypothetical protein